MFSERLIDDVEKIKERSARNFFTYPARKKNDGSQPSFDEKFKRGALRDRKWGDHDYISQLRADCAKIQNDVLEKNGFSIRVDHLSLLAQKATAEQNGDTFLAKLFDRISEKYIGIISCKDHDDQKLERLKKFRELRQHHFDLVLKMDALTKEVDELDTKDLVQFSSTHAKKLIDSNEFLQASPDLKSQFYSAISEVNKWKRVVISRNAAEIQAKIEYMTKSERELWHQYQETLAQKNHLQDFLKTLRKPDDSLKDALQSYDDIVSAVKKKIFALITSSALLNKSVTEIENKLEKSDCKKIFFSSLIKFFNPMTTQEKCSNLQAIILKNLSMIFKTNFFSKLPLGKIFTKRGKFMTSFAVNFSVSTRNTKIISILKPTFNTKFFLLNGLPKWLKIFLFVAVLKNYVRTCTH